MRFVGIEASQLDRLTQIRPFTVAAWRDHLRDRGLAPTSIGRKITVLRSLFTYLQVHGEADSNPAHPHLVATPPVPRDGKTVGLSPEECRCMLDAPDPATPVGVRDRALLAVLAYTGCRVGELCRLRVGDIKMTSGHKIVEIRGKGGKERRVPVSREASKRLDAWLESSGLREQSEVGLFPPARSARGRGSDGFHPRPLSPRSVQLLVARYVRALGLDPAVTVHSFRVTALTTARERGCDLVDIQTFAGHSDPKTTLSYIRNRDRLDKSPAYVLTYGNPETATAT
jgi:integrase/recombinase XerD